MTKEEYLVNPCAKLSIPYWKYLLLKQPHNIDIFHERDYLQNDPYNHVEKYFRLIHYLEKPLKHHQSISDINIAQDMKDLILQINHSYSNERITVNKDDIERWINHPTYDQSLWIKVVVDGHMIASGIAEYDKNTKEGIIEWVQVLPEYRRQGYGRMIVEELLYRLSKKADFVTVSGRLLNDSNPKRLYESCGFKGSDLWYVCYKNKR
jgi:GNAT superfamily N-acetyltransferase